MVCWPKLTLRAFCCVALAVTLGACARTQVQIAVLDPDYVREVQAAAAARDAMQRAQEACRIAGRALNSAGVAVPEECGADKVIDGSSSKRDGRTRPDLAENGGRQTLYAYTAEISGSNALLADVEGVVNEAARNEKLSESQRTEVKAAQEEVKALQEPSPKITGHLGQDGQTLALSDVAFIAANAPPKRWEERFNSAEGIGFGGSTDMVIKLNGTADFSMKGLVFDARATSNAVRKLTTSAVQLLAYGSGMPFASQPVEGDQVRAAVQPLGLLGAQSSIAVEEESQKAYRGALARIAAATLRVASADDEDERTSARTAARNVFLANRHLLATTPAETQPTSTSSPAAQTPTQ